MKKNILSILFFICACSENNFVWGQCQGGSAFGSITPTTSWQTFSGGYGSEYQTFSATAGDIYYFSYCAADGGSSSYDSYLTINDNSGIYVGGGAFNDDFCGDDAYLVWTATSTATFRILTTRYVCNYQGTGSTLAYKKVPGCTPPTAGTVSATANPVCSSPGTWVFNLNGMSGGTIQDWEYSWTSSTGPWTSWGYGNQNPITWGPGGSAGLYVRCRIVSGSCTVWTSGWGPTSVDGTAPSHDNVTVNSNCWITDNTQNYTITLVSTESGLGFGGSYGIMALINYQGSNAGQYGGYFSWHPSTYVWTGDQVVATGGGFASKQVGGGYGDGKITLVSASTSVSGNQRTVIFTVRPNSSFPTLTANDISMYTTDACNNAAGWTNFDLNFTSGASALGTVSNAGPINFCNSADDWTTTGPISVSGHNGSVYWQWGSSNGGWNVWGGAGTSPPGYCCFPEKVSSSDGNADRIRWYVQNGVCAATGYSSAILINNRYNPAPTSLTASASPVCTGTSVTLTANFAGNIDILGTVEFATSCGGAPFASVTAGNNVNSVSTSVTPPVGTTTYYTRYNPGSGTSCTPTTCQSVSVTVDATPVQGTVSNAGPIDFCSATGDWSAVPISVSGSTGTVWWQYGWSSGGWSADWVSGTSPAYNTFPSKVAASDGNADRVRWYVKSTNGACAATGYSSAILLRNRYNAAPTSLTASASPVCTGSSITLTANFASNIDILGTVDFYSGSCGGTILYSITAGNNVNSITTPSFAPPLGTTNYYARYNPGTGSGCSVTACATISVTVDAASVGGSITGGTTPICIGSATGTMTLSGHTGSVLKWQKRVNAGAWADIVNTATTYSETPSSAGTWDYRAEVKNGACSSVFSGTRTIVVDPASVGGSITGGSTPICIGASTGTMTLSGHTGSVLKWQKRVNAGAWSDIVNTATTYSETPSSVGTWDYRAEVKSGSCSSVFSGIRSIVVDALSISGTASSSATSVYSGSTVILTLTGNTGTVQWQSSPAGCASWSNISGATTNPYTTSGITATTCFRAVVTNGACSSVNSNSITVTVITFPMGIVTNGVKVYISNGTYVYVDGDANGDFSNGSYAADDGRIECQSSTAIIKLEGDWTNDASTINTDASGNNVFFTNSGTVNFIGTTAQTINGASPTIFSNLTINNTISGNGGITINTPATVNGLLTLTDGHLISPATGRLTLGSSATVSPTSSTGSGSASSFVSGFLDRVFTSSGTNYDFPMGDSPGNTWRPLTLTAKDATTRTWTSQFVKTDPISVYGSSITNGELLQGMNNIYYYNISRTPSTGNIDLKMWYDPADQTVGESDIVIGHWCDATCGTSTWDNWGKNDPTPGVGWNWDAANNWVQVLNIGTFSPIGPGRKSFPLPVELVYFDAECRNETVELSWKTATETNNDYFTLERSCNDNASYEIVGIMKGSGNSSEFQEYSYYDLNYPGGTCYYRLKQTDFDGTSKYYFPVVSDCEKIEGSFDFNIVSVLPNPTKDFLYISYSAPDEKEITIKVIDVLGKQIEIIKTVSRKGMNYTMVDLKVYSNGFYYVILDNGQKQFVEKIVKRY